MRPFKFYSANFTEVFEKVKYHFQPRTGAEILLMT